MAHYSYNKNAGMKRRLLIGLCFLVVGCATDARLNSFQAKEEAKGESHKLQEIFEQYFEAYLALFPTSPLPSAIIATTTSSVSPSARSTALNSRISTPAPLVSWPTSAETNLKHSTR